MVLKLMSLLFLVISPFGDYVGVMSKIPNRVVVIAMDGIREKEAFPEFKKYITTMSTKGFHVQWRGDQEGCRTSQPYNVSLPAYATIFSGVVQDDIDDNSFNGILTAPTLFDTYQRSQLFSAWRPILNVMSNDELTREKKAFISSTDGLPFDEDKLIMKTFMEKRILSNRFTFVHLGDGDNYAHVFRWNSYMNAVKYEVTYASRIIDTIERDFPRNTYYFVVSDHGRGEKSYNWGNHGEKIPGSEKIWMLSIAPEDTESFQCTHTGLNQMVRGILGEE